MARESNVTGWNDRASSACVHHLVLPLLKLIPLTSLSFILQAEVGLKGAGGGSSFSLSLDSSGEFASIMKSLDNCIHFMSQNVNLSLSSLKYLFTQNLAHFPLRNSLR